MKVMELIRRDCCGNYEVCTVLDSEAGNEVQNKAKGSYMKSVKQVGRVGGHSKKHRNEGNMVK